MQAVRVAVAGGVEPEAAPCVRRSAATQQPIDDFLVSVGRLSARNASTSAGVGGSPVRSSVTRRMSVVRRPRPSAADLRVSSPRGQTIDRIAHPAGLLVSGTAGFLGASNAQWDE